MNPSADLEALSARLTATVAEWYATMRGREFAIGIANGGLHVIELFRATIPLTAEEVASSNGSQVRGLSGASGDRIVRRFVPDARSLGTEAGRTSRGTLPAAQVLREKLNGFEAEITGLSVEERNWLADEMQRWIIDNVILAHQRQLKLEPVLAARLTLVANIAAILEAARERNQGGQVAQHLVGAKLAVRFPNIEIDNFSYSTADRQLNRQGDFQIADTVFHVTMTPVSLLFQKCEENLRQGFRIIVLVPANRHDAAVGLAEDAGIGSQVEVHSIEAFVSQNVSEIAEFNQSRIEADLRRLLEKYNERVAAVEPDRSLLIEIPQNLGGM